MNSLTHPLKRPLEHVFLHVFSKLSIEKDHLVWKFSFWHQFGVYRNVKLVTVKHPLQQRPCHKVMDGGEILDTWDLGNLNLIHVFLWYYDLAVVYNFWVWKFKCCGWKCWKLVRYIKSRISGRCMPLTYFQWSMESALKHLFIHADVCNWKKV